jgi:hypothetical protein
MSDKVHSALFFNVIQLMPAEDWGAVYEYEDKTEKWDSLDWIGLATVTEKVFRNGKEVQSFVHGNEVVGVEFDSDGCFGVSNDCANFVRLMRQSDWEASQKK